MLLFYNQSSCKNCSRGLRRDSLPSCQPHPLARAQSHDTTCPQWELRNSLSVCPGGNRISSKNIGISSFSGREHGFIVFRSFSSTTGPALLPGSPAQSHRGGEGGLRVGRAEWSPSRDNTYKGISLALLLLSHPLPTPHPFSRLVSPSG